MLVHPVRRMMEALLLPSLASFVGRVCLAGVIHDTFRHNIVGGFLAILAQDVLAIAYEYSKMRQRSNRHVRSFDG